MTLKSISLRKLDFSDMIRSSSPSLPDSSIPSNINLSKTKIIIPKNSGNNNPSLQINRKWNIQSLVSLKRMNPTKHRSLIISRTTTIQLSILLNELERISIPAVRFQSRLHVKMAINQDSLFLRVCPECGKQSRWELNFRTVREILNQGKLTILVYDCFKRTCVPSSRNSVVAPKSFKRFSTHRAIRLISPRSFGQADTDLIATASFKASMYFEALASI